MTTKTLTDEDIRCRGCYHKAIDHLDHHCIGSTKDKCFCTKSQKEIFMELLSTYNNELIQLRSILKFNVTLNEAMMKQWREGNKK